MHYTTLGQTGIQISRICLGTMTWGNQNTESDAHAQMSYALEQGVNFWDTAEMYAVPPSAETYGKTEEYIGSWLATNPSARPNIVLASKLAGPNRKWIRGGAGWSPTAIHSAVEASLQRLKTDYLDLYQLHWPSRPYPHHQNHWAFASATNRAEQIETMHMALSTLAECIKQGKIRHIGLSNDTPWGIHTYLNLAEKFNLPRIVSVQNEYSLLYRMDDNYMNEICTLEGISYLPYSPLAIGILTGKYQNGAIPKGTRVDVMGGTSARLTAIAQEATAEYLTIAQQADITPAQLAIAFTLTRPFVTSTIIGATTLEQLKEDIESIDVILRTETMQAIATVHKQYPQPY
ncbi:MAG: aldo/keto reductase [Proteobacteria bacterium]|nr:aldo/keto reductase [Pseudomonadota bacterium]NBX86808.1 aldo/keto reductase [Pseudomonadota bacterium]